MGRKVLQIYFAICGFKIQFIQEFEQNRARWRRRKAKTKTKNHFHWRFSPTCDCSEETGIENGALIVQWLLSYGNSQTMAHFSKRSTGDALLLPRSERSKPNSCCMVAVLLRQGMKMTWFERDVLFSAHYKLTGMYVSAFQCTQH